MGALKIGHSTEIHQDMILEVVADPGLLCAVRGMVRAYVLDAGFSSDKVSEIVLGVDEACTNVIRHAYSDEQECSYRIVFRKSAAWLEIQVQDDGKCAKGDLYRSVEDAGDTVADVDTLAPGGLGVKLIHSVFDEVTYCAETDHGNCVIMRLKRPVEKDNM